jgi:prepilin-type N-terminal cleavage/methylation domain-containing protein
MTDKTVRATLHPTQRAFTLIEMMVVVTLLGIIAILAAPNMSDMIGMRRLRAVNDQLVTDFQYLRSEAVSRNQFMGFVVRNETADSVSCYLIFSNAANPLSASAIDSTACNCANAVGSACSGTHRELRTVQIPRDLSIDLRFPNLQPKLAVASPINGGLSIRPADSHEVVGNEFCIEVRRSPRGRLRTGVSLAGRTSACSPDGSVPGVPVCPAYDATIKNCQAAS